DGTYYHSGLLAIRASIAAKVNITYKILYNDAVAMTGGQPVDGPLSVPQIAAQVHAEGTSRIVIVTDEPEKYNAAIKLPEGVTVHHRDRLDAIQRELREVQGTSVLIYDQTCATEKRRRRKRGTMVDPARRAFINDAVCEGCGDCSVKSNCLSVEPLETELGTKRKINQSSCNKDFSCVNGFCPSFVTAEGAQVRKPESRGIGMDSLPLLPHPELPAIQRAYGVLVTGVGGTGVVTIGGLLGMAAHIEGKGVTVLDMAGLAQKGGAVLSHVQIGERPDSIHATRIAMGEADLVIGCDAIVSASDEVLSKVQHGQTRAIINSTASPTADFIKNPNWRFPGSSAEADIRAAVGDACAFEDANTLAVRLLGDAIFTNPLVLGFAWQKGWIPLTYDALIRAIELNGVAVEKNKTAFEWGRHLAQDRDAVLKLADGAPRAKADVIALPSLDTLIARRVDLLTAYQNAAYAAEFRSVVERVRAAETAVVGAGQTLALTEAVVRNLSKLMAYKDEYEVARLYTDPAFLDKLRAQFEGEPGRDYQLNFWLAPPMTAKRDEKGHLVKQRFGPNTMRIFKVLAKLKGLRGTAFDVFGKTEERRTERALIGEYRALVDELVKGLNAQKLAQAVELARLPEDIRGFGHVKEANLAATRIRWNKLLAQLRDPAAAQRAA
ncbi:MAG: indolepyruvate ferredoxin oxidoreductase family protein, partial [Janthinobacterium lividum]